MKLKNPKFKGHWPDAGIFPGGFLFVKIDPVIFEVNITNYSQDITKKHFHPQLTIPQHTQT